MHNWHVFHKVLIFDISIFCFNNDSIPADVEKPEDLIRIGLVCGVSPDVMFRLRSFRACSRRLFHCGAVSRDQVLEQLQTCSAEEQLFDVVGRNKAKLSVSHVSCAIVQLWKFQRGRAHMLRTIEQVRTHPQFLTLRVLAENKISLMDDASVVDVLYVVLRYRAEIWGSKKGSVPKAN